MSSYVFIWAYCFGSWLDCAAAAVEPAASAQTASHVVNFMIVLLRWRRGSSLLRYTRLHRKRMPLKLQLTVMSPTIRELAAMQSAGELIS
jgi:hypothetical protein